MTIFDKIVEERKRQDEKWGEQNHHGFVWNAILMEEVGEVATEVYESTIVTPDLSNTLVKEELIQVAAVAIAWIECIERNEEV